MLKSPAYLNECPLLCNEDAACHAFDYDETQLTCWKWTNKDDVGGSPDSDANAICYIKDFWAAIAQLDETVDKAIRASANYDQMRLADKNDLDAFLKGKSADR